VPLVTIIRFLLQSFVFVTVLLGEESIYLHAVEKNFVLQIIPATGWAWNDIQTRRVLVSRGMMERLSTDSRILFLMSFSRSV